MKSRSRILALDALRGLCLCEMMMHHLPANLTMCYTGALGFISAAEGFVFLSGFVAAYTAFSALQANRSHQAVAQRFTGRAAQLYLTYAVMLTVAYACIHFGGEHFTEWRKLCYLGPSITERDWLAGMVFLHQPAYLDILPMYCAFLALTPLMLVQLQAGRTCFLATISGALWMVSQFWTSPVLPPVVRFGFFNVFSWQLLFVGGLLFGWWRHKRSLEPPPSMIGFIISAAACLVFSALGYPHWGGRLLNDSILAQKSTLGILRIANFSAMAYSIWYALARMSARLENSRAFQMLAFLGQHSLQVFSWTIAITFIALLGGDSWWHFRPVAQVALVAGICASLWAPAWLHARWRSNQQRYPAPRQESIPAPVQAMS